MTARALGLVLCLVASIPVVAAAQGTEQARLQPGEVLVRLETPFGVIQIAVDTKRAPITAANFLKTPLANGRSRHGACRLHPLVSS